MSGIGNIEILKPHARNVDEEKLRIFQNDLIGLYGIAPGGMSLSRYYTELLTSDNIRLSTSPRLQDYLYELSKLPDGEKTPDNSDSSDDAQIARLQRIENLAYGGDTGVAHSNQNVEFYRDMLGQFASRGPNGGAVTGPSMGVRVTVPMNPLVARILKTRNSNVNPSRDTRQQLALNQLIRDEPNRIQEMLNRGDEHEIMRLVNSRMAYMDGGDSMNIIKHEVAEVGRGYRNQNWISRGLMHSENATSDQNAICHEGNSGSDGMTIDGGHPNLTDIGYDNMMDSMNALETLYGAPNLTKCTNDAQAFDVAYEYYTDRLNADGIELEDGTTLDHTLNVLCVEMVDDCRIEESIVQHNRLADIRRGARDIATGARERAGQLATNARLAGTVVRGYASAAMREGSRDRQQSRDALIQAARQRADAAGAARGRTPERQAAIEARRAERDQRRAERRRNRSRNRVERQVSGNVAARQLERNLNQQQAQREAHREANRQRNRDRQEAERAARRAQLAPYIDEINRNTANNLRQSGISSRKLDSATSDQNVDIIAHDSFYRDIKGRFASPGIGGGAATGPSITGGGAASTARAQQATQTRREQLEGRTSDPGSMSNTELNAAIRRITAENNLQRELDTFRKNNPSAAELEAQAVQAKRDARRERGQKALGYARKLAKAKIPDPQNPTKTIELGQLTLRSAMQARGASRAEANAESERLVKQARQATDATRQVSELRRVGEEAQAARAQAEADRDAAREERNRAQEAASESRRAAERANNNANAAYQRGRDETNDIWQEAARRYQERQQNERQSTGSNVPRLGDGSIEVTDYVVR